MATIKQIVFMQGDDAREVIDRLDNIDGVVVHGHTEESVIEAVEYLSQWDYGDDSPNYELPSVLPTEKRAEHNGYIVTWSTATDYVSLDFIVE